jgi:hypothetical protein
VRYQLLALDRTVAHLRTHRGLTPAYLDDLDSQCTIERGL